ncbi:MAG: MarR family transcriptional regulator [Christensenellales bacterium]
MTEEDIRTLLNGFLKDLFFKILRIQEKSVSQTSNDSISRTEMHALEVIQQFGNNVTLTQLADKLGITKATASVCISRLEKKDYVEKVKLKKDKRKSVLKLNEKGEYLCLKHAEFHEKMIDCLLKDFKIFEYPQLLKGLEALYHFFNKIEKELV